MLDVDGDGKIEYEEFMETVKASMAAEKSGGSGPGGMSADSRVAMDKLAEKLLTNAVRGEEGAGAGANGGERSEEGSNAGGKWGAAGRGNTKTHQGRMCAYGGDTGLKNRRGRDRRKGRQQGMQVALNNAPPTA